MGLTALLSFLSIMVAAGSSVINYQQQKNNSDYIKEMNERSWERDDTSIQRAKQDALDAGFSPLAAIGNPAPNSNFNNTDANTFDSSGLLGALDSAGGRSQQSPLIKQEVRSMELDNDLKEATLENEKLKVAAQLFKLQQDGLISEQQAKNITAGLGLDGYERDRVVETKRHNLAMENKSIADFQLERDKFEFDKNKEEKEHGTETTVSVAGPGGSRITYKIYDKSSSRVGRVPIVEGLTDDDNIATQSPQNLGKWDLSTIMKASYGYNGTDENLKYVNMTLDNLIYVGDYNNFPVFKTNKGGAGSSTYVFIPSSTGVQAYPMKNFTYSTRSASAGTGKTAVMSGFAELCKEFGY